MRLSSGRAVGIGGLDSAGAINRNLRVTTAYARTCPFAHKGPSAAPCTRNWCGPMLKRRLACVSWQRVRRPRA